MGRRYMLGDTYSFNMATFQKAKVVYHELSEHKFLLVTYSPDVRSRGHFCVYSMITCYSTVAMRTFATGKEGSWDERRR